MFAGHPRRLEAEVGVLPPKHDKLLFYPVLVIADVAL